MTASPVGPSGVSGPVDGRSVAGEQRDERGRLYSVVAEGRRFYYVAQLADNYVRVLAERDGLRAEVERLAGLVRRRAAAVEVERDELRNALQRALFWVTTFDCDCFGGSIDQDAERCDRCTMLDVFAAALVSNPMMAEPPITGREAGYLRVIREGAAEKRALRAERDWLRGVAQAGADDLRELAEAWLYDGDTDQPVNEGYYRLLDLADSLAGPSPAVLPETPKCEHGQTEGHWTPLRGAVPVHKTRQECWCPGPAGQAAGS